MKKKISMLLAILMLITIIPTAFADGAKEMKAVKSSQKITLDKEVVEVAAYNIAGSNYLKLRDVATIMTGKKKQFNIDYNAERKLIVVETGKPYTKLESDLKPIKEASAKAILSEKEIILNGDDEDIDTAFINESNYVKLRDIAKIANFYVGYDEASQTVILKSDEAYLDNDDKNDDKDDDDDKEDKKDDDKKVSELSIYDLYEFDGDKDNILEDIKENNYTLINLWSTASKESIDELTAIAKLEEEYDDKEDKAGNDRLGVIGIVMDIAPYKEGLSEKEAADRKAAIAKASEALKNAKVDYDNYTLSTEAKEHFDKIAKTYPTSIIVDKTGKVVKTIEGTKGYEELKKIVDIYVILR
ncbi:stalk domain-containing protein [Fenollaria timonensis]|uniref:stalk domain-containing protein n=1 Tax=Fenollaria timonensis TaxID=1723384 RepID=UPI00071C34ED|nr:stalk domain-containing protein [Fenollaria timonensis]